MCECAEMGQKENTNSSRNSGTLTVKANISSKCCKTWLLSAGSWSASVRYGVFAKASVGSCPSSLFSSVPGVAASTSICSKFGPGVCKRLSSFNANSRMRLPIGWTSGAQRLIVLIAAPRVIFSRYVKKSPPTQRKAGYIKGTFMCGQFQQDSQGLVPQRRPRRNKLSQSVETRRHPKQ